MHFTNLVTLLMTRSRRIVQGQFPSVKKWEIDHKPSDIDTYDEKSQKVEIWSQCSGAHVLMFILGQKSRPRAASDAGHARTKWQEHKFRLERNFACGTHN